MNKQIYKKFKKAVEEKLRAYPYYLISLEQNCDEDIKTIIKVIEIILDKLDKQSQVIIKEFYFSEEFDKEKLLKELNIDNNIFYRKKRKALEKFIMGLGYL